MLIAEPRDCPAWLSMTGFRRAKSAGSIESGYKGTTHTIDSSQALQRRDASHWLFRWRGLFKDVSDHARNTGPMRASPRCGAKIRSGDATYN